MITKRQKQVLDFINSFQNKHRYAPSYKEYLKGLWLQQQNCISFFSLLHKIISKRFEFLLFLEIPIYRNEDLGAS